MKKINYKDKENIKFYNPDVELSEFFGKSCSDLIGLKDCYNNVARILNKKSSLVKKYPGICIVYGGVQITVNRYDSDNKLFVKHCFFKYNDKAIDPTIYNINNKLNERAKYFSVIEYSIEEYLDMLSTYKDTLPNNIMKEMNIASLDLFNHEIVLVG